MADPENMTFEILKDIRADMREMRDDMRRVESKVDDVEIKLDGLTHAVIAGFGSIVHELDEIKTRVSRLETERT
ncbi:MAG: hypothetical protein ACJ8DU_20230 [Microvirga sp.]|jgi:hypothetical protein|nr:hypothetical protein [Beijerinckiaceae bacterium]HZY22282.1 hypothetical protein [Beijerinckiaceae bacterium]